jgi:hypothetical protein
MKTIQDNYTNVSPHVYVNDKGWIPTKMVKIVNVSEDIHGHNVFTFIYENKEHMSNITLHPSEL